jgi:polyisoprenoid-binding protein YceI
MNRLLLIAATLWAASASPTYAADWKTDAGTSRLEFAATYESNIAPGVFREFDARLRFDADRPAEGRLDVTIIVKSADMNSADIDKAISGPEWFDFARFPQAEFHATDIRQTDASRFLAHGMLSVKGVQRPVAVPFTWTKAGDAARMDGEFTVKRGDFGIGSGDWAATSVIGADVKIKFTVRLHNRG